ncbi:MAG: hypothetical protein EA378_01255 [Phycisphaerales bacterium]|nr:MAG: hypothetical protein EA378_01255 [Phycisphaerales bacterium]
MAGQAMGTVQFTNFSEFESSESTEVSTADGAFWASMGVVFQTGQIAGDINVGNVINWTLVSPLLTVYSNDDAVSGRNFIGAYDTNRLDSVLMQFDAEDVNFVSLHTDLALEGADLVRLIALRQVDGGFEVLNYMEAWDNALTLEDSYMEVFTGDTAMTHAIFQVNTEREGFDNLTFGNAVIPAPGASLLAISGIAMVGRRRRR